MLDSPLGHFGPEPELWIPEQEGHQDRQDRQAARRHVQDDGLLVGLRDLPEGSEALHHVHPPGVVPADMEESLLSDAADGGGEAEAEGGRPEDGVDRDQPGSEASRGSLAGQEEEEAEESQEELEGEESHGGQTQPGVEAVEVEDGRLGPALVVPDCQEPHDDAGDGQQVEQAVDQLAVDPPAAGAGPVDQHS